ncbi:hypothetical protein GQX74_002501 [Glossina fuscipes]|nr:hypothetical protein GQX74_002501 [Glossina fuscipes]
MSSWRTLIGHKHDSKNARVLRLATVLTYAVNVYFLYTVRVTNHLHNDNTAPQRTMDVALFYPVDLCFTMYGYPTNPQGHPACIVQSTISNTECLNMPPQANT